MMLVEATPIADAVLPVNEFKAHLRLGSGFGTDSLQDALLIGFLRAAVTAVEGRIGKALFLRGFRYSTTAWKCADVQALPVAPVAGVTAFQVLDRMGSASVVPVETYWLEPDWAQPRLRSVGYALPAIPDGGTAVIEFDAGFGATWGEVPADLQQAVLLLAAHYYEFRHDTTRDGAQMPFGVVNLVERYRSLRLSAGGVA